MAGTAADTGIWWRALAVWLLMAAAESVHGVLRELFIVPALGRPVAQQLGFVVGCIIILGIAVLAAPWLRADTRVQQWRIGAFWTLLMLGFEVGIGLARGMSPARILADYDPSAGGLMLVGVAVLLLSPRIAATLRSARHRR